jgi:lysozyme
MMKRNSLSIYIFIPVLILSGLALFCGCSAPPDEQSSDDENSTVTFPVNAKGIDVSHFSGTVDWQKVKVAGYAFAFAKVTEGNDFKDPMFDTNWPAMKAAGIIRGAYHFYVTEDEPDTQAAFFIQNLKLLEGDFAPVVDIEVLGDNTETGLVDRLKSFLSTVETHFGIKPIIYTGLNFWDENMNNQFSSYPLWIAEYGVEEPVDPTGWNDWHIWQWKGDATVSGVEKSADLNVLNQKEKDFTDLRVK